MIERIKTLIILLLILSLALLLFISLSLSTAALPLKPSDMLYELFGNVKSRNAQTGDSLKEAAALPCRIAVTGEGGVYAPVTPSQYEETYHIVCTCIEESVATAKGYSVITADEYEKALLNDGIIFIYDRPLPFGLISEWYGRKSEKEDFSFISLFASCDGEQIFLYLRTGDGRFFRFETGVDKAALLNACGTFSPNGVLARLLPGAVCDRYSPLPTEYYQMPSYSVLPPAFGNGTELTRDILKDLSINTYITSVYNDGDSLVYVEGQNTLRLFADGKIVYLGNLDKGALYNGDGSLSELLSGVLPVISSLWQKTSSPEALLNLSSVYTDKEGRTVFAFDACIGGCLVDRGEDACTVTFDGGKIVGIALYPLMISYFQDVNTLSYAQASAAVNPGDFLRMQYLPDENGYLIPRLRGLEGGKD